MREALALALGERRAADLPERHRDPPKKKSSAAIGLADRSVEDTIHYASPQISKPQATTAQNEGRKRSIVTDALELWPTVPATFQNPQGADWTLREEETCE